MLRNKKHTLHTTRVAREEDSRCDGEGRWGYQQTRMKRAMYTEDIHGIVERTNFILQGSAARAERRGNVSTRLGGICENVEIEWERGER